MADPEADAGESGTGATDAADSADKLPFAFSKCSNVETFNLKGMVRSCILQSATSAERSRQLRIR